MGFQNPLFNQFTFNVNAAYLHSDSLGQIERELEQLAGVRDVYYQEGLVSDIARNMSWLGWLAIGIAALFLFIAVVLIHNTIRLALYANRFLIKNMELVGASWGFISRPYLLRSIGYGSISAILALIGLAGLAWSIQQKLNISDMLPWPTLATLACGLLFLGISITTLSTFFVVHKYLKMRVDDLY